MVTKPRLANRTIWALEDILDEVERGNVAWSKLHRRAKDKRDLVTLAGLAELRDAMARIERLTLDARHGKYHQGQGDGN